MPARWLCLVVWPAPKVNKITEWSILKSGSIDTSLPETLIFLYCLMPLYLWRILAWTGSVLWRILTYTYSIRFPLVGSHF
jgi:hypothetical protein